MRVDNPTAAPVNIQEFGPGDHTWVMPDGARLIQVSVIAGGGGGTSGSRGTPIDAADTIGVNGIAGEGGGWAIMTFPASNLDSEVPVTVGVGGIGDTGATTDGGIGSGATDGGATNFGGYLTVAGGRCISPDGTVIPPIIRSMLTPGGPIQPDAAGCPGGGTGGSLFVLSDGEPATITVAGMGGRSTLTGYPPASAGDTDGIIGGGDGTSQGTGQPMPGAGGGGGAASVTGPGGNGGNGGNYGAGGGGGGASGDGYPSGDGGNGGDGICVVVTYF